MDLLISVGKNVLGDLFHFIKEISYLHYIYLSTCHIYNDFVL